MQRALVTGGTGFIGSNIVAPGARLAGADPGTARSGPLLVGRWAV